MWKEFFQILKKFFSLITSSLISSLTCVLGMEKTGMKRRVIKGKKCLNDIFKNLSDIKLFLEIVIFLMNQEEEKEKQKKIFSKKSRQRSHWHSINGKQWKEARSTSRPSQSCTEAVKHSRANKRCNGLFLSHISPSQTRRSKLQRILRTVEMERIIITLRIIIAFRNGGTLSLASNSSLSLIGEENERKEGS